MHRFSVNYELWNIIYVKLPNSLLWRRLSDKQLQSWAPEMQSEFFAFSIRRLWNSRTFPGHINKASFVTSILCHEHPLSCFFLKHLCCCVLWWNAVRQHCSALLRALADLRAVSESKSQHLSVKVQMSHKASSANADGMQKCATQTGPFWTPARLPREVSMKSILQPPSCFGSGWTPNTPRYMLVLTMRCMWYW